jgi:beta-aspartyl-peptidase (threonine type)
MLEEQARAWNAGDLEAFMDPYWSSPDLTFSGGGRVTRGWEPVLDNYRKRYPDREAMGQLAFSDLEITELGEDAALVLGRWELKRKEPVGGVFTLVLRRMDGRWLIVHDHTSRDSG